MRFPVPRRGWGDPAKATEIEWINSCSPQGLGDPGYVIIGNSPSSRSKQFLYGLIANQEGIPFYGAPEDGNKNDKTWDKELLEKHQLRID